MSDRSLTCRDCGQEFVFTLGEQEFYLQRGFSDPQRCNDCRQARKTQRGGAGGSSYGSGGGGGYGGSSGGGSSHGSSGGGYGGSSSYGDDSNRAPRQLYPATCSECGQQTEVPFNPTPGKPVYCRECFSSRKSSSRYNTF